MEIKRTKRGLSSLFTLFDLHKTISRCFHKGLGTSPVGTIPFSSFLAGWSWERGTSGYEDR